MDANSLVSIVTPFKNTSKFLSDTLQSIVNQTYPNWELLIVDDNSTDNGYAIVSEWAKKDSRIRLFKSTGSGIISALQLAYSQSKGEFITRMDSDDIMSPDKLKIMVNDLKTYGKGNVSIGLVKYFSEGQLGDGFKSYEKWLNQLSSTGTNFREIYKECVIPSPCWMVHRSDFESCGAFESFTYPEDYDLTFRMFEAELKCIPTDSILHHWRDYPLRASRTDSNYADNTFMDLKLHYFLKLHRIEIKPLVVWGAGAKGKNIAKKLLELNVPFHWVCDNPKKIGKEIYGQPMLGFHVIDDLENAQNIITVANQNAQSEIRNFFDQRKKESLIDYFFFC